MLKIAIGPKALIYPTPALVIGANVDGKPNFMTAAWSGIANSNPPMISVAVQPSRYTYKGIKQNGTFSINIPSVDMVKETDYCGITAGAKVDKVKVCGFRVAYGKLKTAPMIEQFPVSLECRVVHTLELGSHSLFIGQVEEVFVMDSCLMNGKPAVDKIRPIIYTETERIP